MVGNLQSNSRLTSQEILRFLWKPMFQHYTDNRLPLVPTLKNMNPVHTTLILFNIIPLCQVVFVVEVL